MGEVGGMGANEESRFAASHALRMFPTFVWQAELESGIHRRINRTIAAKLDEIRRSTPALDPGQVWQSAQDLHTLDEFRELVSCVDEAAATSLSLNSIVIQKA